MAFGHSLAISPSNHPIIAKGQVGDKSISLFNLARHYLLKGNAVIMLLDDKAANDIVSPPRPQNATVEGRLDLQHYIESGRLLPVPISKFKKTNSPDTESLVQKWIEVIEQVHNKNRRREIIIVADCSHVTAKMFGDMDRQVAFGLAINSLSQQSKILEKLKLADVICTYETATIDQMLVRQLVLLLGSHGLVLSFTDSIQSIKSDINRVHQCIATGINNVMGQGSDRLIYKTLDSVYGFKEDQIISQPFIFEGKLERMLGRSTRRVLDSIANELRGEIYNLTKFQPVGR